MSNMGNQTGNSTPNPKIQSFLEALRNSQGKTSDNGNFERPNPFAEFQQKKEAEKNRTELFFKARQQEWNRVFSAKEKQTEQRIEEIREQLKQLAKQVKKLDVNLVKAVQSPVAQAGEYHLNFLEHIKNMIYIFNLKVQEANSWLEVYNSRSQKKGAYWGMAKKSGNNFTQANERTVATSVG